MRIPNSRTKDPELGSMGENESYDGRKKCTIHFFLIIYFVNNFLIVYSYDVSAFIL